MTKQKQLTISLDAISALELLQVLDGSTAGYSKEFAPARVERLRSIMNELDKELEKLIV
jgi:hypothetical protein